MRTFVSFSFIISSSSKFVFLPLAADQTKTSSTRLSLSRRPSSIVIPTQTATARPLRPIRWPGVIIPTNRMTWCDHSDQSDDLVLSFRPIRWPGAIILALLSCASCHPSLTSAAAPCPIPPHSAPRQPTPPYPASAPLGW